MTQADGILPTSAELRRVLGRAKVVYAAYEKALTVAAVGLQDAEGKPSVEQQYRVLASLSAAHADLSSNLSEVRTFLGLPYDPVIEATGELIV
jgi:hypothetical protein